MRWEQKFYQDCIVQAGYAQAMAGLSPLDMWEGDLYIPLTILVAVTVFRVVWMWV